MPVIVHVKHYLNPNCLTNFNHWFDKVYQFMSDKKGFVDLTHQVLPSQDNTYQLIYIKLVFNHTDNLEAWVNDPIHDQLVNELDLYRAKPYWEACRTTDENLSWQQATYDIIQAQTPSAHAK